MKWLLSFLATSQRASFLKYWCCSLFISYMRWYQLRYFFLGVAPCNSFESCWQWKTDSIESKCVPALSLSVYTNMVNVYIYIIIYLNTHTIIYNICNIYMYIDICIMYGIKRGSNITLIHYHHSTDRSTNLPSQQPKFTANKMIGHNFLDVVFQGMMRFSNLAKYIWLDLRNHFFDIPSGKLT